MRWGLSRFATQSCLIDCRRPGLRGPFLALTVRRFLDDSGGLRQSRRALQRGARPVLFISETTPCRLELVPNRSKTDDPFLGNAATELSMSRLISVELIVPYR